MSLLNGKNRNEPKCPIAQMVCPRNNDSQLGSYCPVWVEYIQTEINTGEERVVKECGYQANLKFLIEVLKASNRPAAAIESTRNEIAKGFTEIVQRMYMLPQAVAQAQAQTQTQTQVQQSRELNGWQDALIATDRSDQDGNDNDAC